MHDRPSILLWGAGGLIWGLLIALGSLVVAGAGHGWVSALPFGFLAILSVPMATIAWAGRKTYGRKLALVAVLVAVVSDVALLLATLAEGTEFFLELLFPALVWLVLWVSWQGLAVAVLFFKPLVIKDE